MGAFSCIHNGPPKGKFNSVLSCFMSSSITPLLLSPHPRQFYFRYGIEDVLCLWKNMG